MPEIRAVPVSLPSHVIKRLEALAPMAGDRQRLLQQFVLEGLNRYELDCLWCSIKERKADGKREGMDKGRDLLVNILR